MYFCGLISFCRMLSSSIIPHQRQVPTTAEYSLSSSELRTRKFHNLISMEFAKNQNAIWMYTYSINLLEIIILNGYNNFCSTDFANCKKYHSAIKLLLGLYSWSNCRYSLFASQHFSRSGENQKGTWEKRN